MLLATKLLKPRLPSGFLSRTRPLQALDDATEKPLCLVCAPAGYGKTTLLVDWLEQRRKRAAWLSVEASENDAVAFWFALCSALSQLDPRFMENVWPQFTDTGEGTRPGIHALVNELWAWSRSWAANDTIYLVIDDFHVLKEPGLLSSFDWFLDHLPNKLRLILASRTRPSLSFARRRSAGQCKTITEDSLRFTREGTEQLFTEHFNLPLSADQVQNILARTEGWPVALQLTGLAWQEGAHGGSMPEPTLDEAHGLSEYLMAEVFQRQPEAVQSFLIRIARLPRFSAGLCDALLQRRDSEGMLEYLVQQNLLIQALDEQRQWFRLHDLFRDWLKTQPLAESEDNDLRLRAARWLQDEGYSYEAFEQWIALKAWGDAARQVTLHFLVWWQQGWLPRAESGLRQFPRAWRVANPWLRYLEGFILFQRGELINAAQALREAEHCFNHQRHWAIGGEALFAGEESLTDSVRAEFPLHLASLRAHIARLEGDIQTAIELSEGLQKAVQFSDSPFLDWTLAGCCTDRFFNMNLPLAREYGVKAIHQARRNHNPSCQIASLAWLVPTLIHQGECKEAMAWIDRTQASIGPGWRTNVWAPNLPYQRAVILREQNQLDAAANFLDEALAMVTDQLMPQCLVYFEFLHWQIALNRGDFDTAETAIERIEYWHFRQDVSDWHYMVPEPELMRALLRAAQGHIESLLAWTYHFDPALPPTPSWLDFARLAVWLRVQVDLGGDIAHPLSRFRAQVEAGGVLTWQVKAALLDHRLAQQENRESAKPFMHKALWLSLQHNQLRTFLDDGPGLTIGLQGCLDDQGVGKEAGRILAAMGVEVPRQARANEPLSERERQILALLESGRSNPELARELGVSLSTIKAHLRNIFVKLGVKNRTQAIARAGKFGFISQSPEFGH
jgi:LuxR family maltose regulon positive regulatory protein